MKHERTGFIDVVRSLVSAHPGITKHDIMRRTGCALASAEYSLWRAAKNGELVCVKLAEQKRNVGRWYAACNAPGPDGKPRPTCDSHPLSQCWPMRAQ